MVKTPRNALNRHQFGWTPVVPVIGMKPAIETGTMRNPRLDTPPATASVLLGTGLVLILGLVAGCGGDGVIAPDPTWEEVRYHWSDAEDGSNHGDLTVLASGQIAWDLQGAGAPTRGLLAGGNLETLTRLIDALPPAGYEGPNDCGRRYFITIQTANGVREYRAGDCDPAAPGSVRHLTEQLDRWIADAAGRFDPIPFRVLAQGSTGGLGEESRIVVRSKDELIRLVSRIDDEAVAVFPRVDFRAEIVLAIFAGTHPGEGHGVELTGAHRTEGGQVLLSERWTIVDPSCAGEANSAPYQIVALSTRGYESLMSDVEVVTIRPCDPIDGLGSNR